MVHGAGRRRVGKAGAERFGQQRRYQLLPGLAQSGNMLIQFSQHF
jgi:hypothetical protein